MESSDSEDVILTMDDVVKTRTNMLSNIQQYMNKGSYDRGKMAPRQFSKEKTPEEQKNAAFQRQQMMAAKRASRQAESTTASSPGGGGGDDVEGEEDTQDTRRAKEFENMKLRKDKAIRRRSHSRGQSSDVSPSPNSAVASSAASSPAILSAKEEAGSDDEEDVDPASAEAARKQAELLTMIKRKERATARRARTIADEKSRGM